MTCIYSTIFRKQNPYDHGSAAIHFDFEEHYLGSTFACLKRRGRDLMVSGFAQCAVYLDNVLACRCSQAVHMLGTLVLCKYLQPFVSHSAG